MKEKQLSEIKALITNSVNFQKIENLNFKLWEIYHFFYIFKYFSKEKDVQLFSYQYLQEPSSSAKMKSPCWVKEEE